jgi:hypothetical protein
MPTTKITDPMYVELQPELPPLSPNYQLLSQVILCFVVHLFYLIEYMYETEIPTLLYGYSVFHGLTTKLSPTFKCNYYKTNIYAAYPQLLRTSWIRPFLSMLLFLRGSNDRGTSCVLGTVGGASS